MKDQELAALIRAHARMYANVLDANNYGNVALSSQSVERAKRILSKMNNLAAELETLLTSTTGDK